MANYGGGAGGGSAEMGDAQTMAAVKNVRSFNPGSSNHLESRPRIGKASKIRA
jgi:hypothetical protein